MSNFVKNDTDKPRYELIPPHALELVVKILTMGAKKYDDDNWKKCPDIDRYFGACQRHLWAWKAGDKIDSESDINHLAHAICSLLFMLELDKEKK